MIYTVTLNPAIDYIINVKDFATGVVNRSEEERVYPGGKGINVSIVLKNLGIENTALGFQAGFTGLEIERQLKKRGVWSDFIKIKEGFSRINIKLRSGQETEINAKGPAIQLEDLENLFKKLEKLEDGDFLVLAGNIPSNISDSIYQEIMRKLSDKNIHIVVDATKDLLRNVLCYHPFFIKPNQYELGELFGVQIENRDQAIEYGKQLKKMGAQNVLVSMGGKGAVLIDEDEKVYQSQAPKGEVVYSVGAGDSMVAGFLAGFLKDGTYQTAFLMGIATGSASAFSSDLATKKEVDAILAQMGKNI